MPDERLDESQLSNQLYELTGMQTIADVLAKFPDQAMIVISEQERVKKQKGAEWKQGVAYRDMSGRDWGGQQLRTEGIVQPLINIEKTIDSLRGNNNVLVPEGVLDESGLGSILWAVENKGDKKTALYTAMLEKLAVDDDDIWLLRKYEEAKSKSDSLRQEADQLERTIAGLSEDIGKVHEYAKLILLEAKAKLDEKLTGLRTEADEKISQVMERIRAKYHKKSGD